jgi:hypothetical protein
MMGGIQSSIVVVGGSANLPKPELAKFIEFVKLGCFKRGLG